MLSFIRKRSFASLISLIGLIVMVFFLSRLTGDPAALFLPVEASEELKQQFRALHGLNDPLMVQFLRYAGDVMTGDLGESLRKARPALDVVLEAFVWTLWLAVITMSLVTTAAIIIGSLAAFRSGGFDRVASSISLIGASVPDFWLAIVAIVVFRQPGLASHVRHRVCAALDIAYRGPVCAPLRHYRAGGARLDDRRAVLGLCQNGARQGCEIGSDHLHPRLAQCHVARDHRYRRSGGEPSQRRRRG